MTVDGIAGTAYGRGQKRDNTKQTTLFGLPAVSASEKPEKRSRKKGGADSQDVEMAETQGVNAATSQVETVTAVDSQPESQATEVITTQVKGAAHPYTVLKADTK